MKKFFALIISCGLLAACTGAPVAEPTSAADATPGFQKQIDYIPAALGAFSWTITTNQPKAQEYFTQGMQLRWAFNIDDSIRSMTAARRIDPECAMCYWGEAFALGPFLNGGMSDEKILAVNVEKVSQGLTHKVDGRKTELILSIDDGDVFLGIRETTSQGGVVKSVGTTSIRLTEEDRQVLREAI